MLNPPPDVRNSAYQTAEEIINQSEQAGRQATQEAQQKIHQVLRAEQARITALAAESQQQQQQDLASFRTHKAAHDQSLQLQQRAFMVQIEERRKASSDGEEIHQRELAEMRVKTQEEIRQREETRKRLEQEHAISQPAYILPSVAMPTTQFPLQPLQVRTPINLPALSATQLPSLLPLPNVALPAVPTFSAANTYATSNTDYSMALSPLPPLPSLASLPPLPPQPPSNQLQ